jgi:hypothetical protein
VVRARDTKGVGPMSIVPAPTRAEPALNTHGNTFLEKAQHAVSRSRLAPVRDRLPDCDHRPTDQTLVERIVTWI